MAAHPTDDPTPVEETEAYRAVADEARRRQAEGKALQHHHVRALREESLLAIGEYVYPDISAAALGEGVSATTLRTWASKGCPIATKGPIPKHAIATWRRERAEQELAQLKEKQGGKDLDEELKQLRIDERRGNLEREAEDRARSAIDQVLAYLIADLEDRLPAEARKICAELPSDAVGAEEGIRRTIKAILPDTKRRFDAAYEEPKK